MHVPHGRQGEQLLTKPSLFTVIWLLPLFWQIWNCRVNKGDLRLFKKAPESMSEVAREVGSLGLLPCTIGVNGRMLRAWKLHIPMAVNADPGAHHDCSFCKISHNAPRRWLYISGHWLVPHTVCQVRWGHIITLFVKLATSSLFYCTNIVQCTWKGLVKKTVGWYFGRVNCLTFTAFKCGIIMSSMMTTYDHDFYHNGHMLIVWNQNP